MSEVRKLPPPEIINPKNDANQHSSEQQNKAKKKPRGRPFVKGSVANPGGRPKLPPEIKAVALMTKHEIAEIGSELLRENITHFENILLKKEDHSMLKVMMATAIVNTAKAGDPVMLDRILDRIVGKVTNEIHVQARVENTIEHRISAMSPEEIRTATAKAIQLMKDLDESK
jgi:hypothetical protein